MSNNMEKAQSQYERKLARQRQLELMEATASGTAPSMELQIESSEHSANTNSSGLRSRDSRRLVENEFESSSSGSSSGRPQAPMSSRANTTTGSSTGNLFDIRGRPDGLPTNTGVNLMDHDTGIYRETTRVEAFMGRIRSMFGASATSSDNMMYDAADMTDEYPSKRSMSSCGQYWNHVQHNRRTRAMLMLVIAGAIFFVLLTVTTMRFVRPWEKFLRAENDARYSAIMDEITVQGISVASDFLNNKNPQYHALRWVAYSDPARLPPSDPMVLTRYALAVFFYNGFLVFEKHYGHQSPIEIDGKQWEGVPNPGWIEKEHWLTEKGVCLWHGVYCAAKTVNNQDVTQYDANEPVLALKIHRNHIRGSLVAEFKALDALKVLDLTENKITGSFPSALGKLHALEYLHLPNNRITGSLPSEIGFLESVKKVELRHNEFSGQLPTQLNRLYDLELLQLNHNKFSGTIPDLSSLSKIKGLHLNNNGLRGVFPFTMAVMLSLTDLYINFNEISGTIPGEIESIRGLERLHVSSNKIEGEIPKHIFSHLSHLREVSFDNNAMVGKLANDTDAMVQLELFNLNNNKFEGSIPDSWGQVTSLQKLHMTNNKLTGTLPTTLGQLKKVKEIWFQGNELSGSIPRELAYCEKLESLQLQQNHLKGSVPSELGYLTSLHTFQIQENKITGDMPKQVCRLRDRNSLKIINVDCKEVACLEECCSECK